MMCSASTALKGLHATLRCRACSRGQYFSPLPTSWEAFVEKLHFPPGAHPAEPRHQTGAFWAARERAKGGRFTLVEGSCFAAQPGGPAATAAYERMRDTILAEIKAALPLDGVVLALHGAMVAFGYDDCEGDLLERVRSLVGADCVIGVEFDPHCHLTRRKCAFADIIILFKEYPHTDFVARGEEVVTLVLDAIAGQGEAGALALRLPYHRELPDHGRADALPRR